MTLTFKQLRKANVERLPTFRNAKGIAYHLPDGSDWSLTEWATALVGEVGEAANLIKKVVRGDFTLDDIRWDLADELSDVQIYLDIVAYRSRVDIYPEISFGQLRAVTVTGWGDVFEKGLSLSDEMVKLSRWIGDIAYVADMHRSGRYSDEGARKKLTQYIHDAQDRLDHIAFRAGVDLGKATVVKFNAVSIRVGSPVFIEDDKGRRTKCEACGHVQYYDIKKSTAHLRFHDSHWSQPCSNCNETIKMVMTDMESELINKTWGRM